MNVDRMKRLERVFEGMEALAELLDMSGCDLTAEEVVEEFHCAVEEGTLAHEVIPLLWEQEPIFQNTDQARRTFSNLFGLFENIAQDSMAELVPLPTLDPDAPITPEHADRTWRVMEGLSDSDWRRSRDRFDNRQAEIGTFVFEQLQHLDQVAIEAGLILAFEAWWILEAIRGEARLRQPSRQLLNHVFGENEGSAAEVEPALAIQASTALWERAADEEIPLGESDIPYIETVLRAVRIALTRDG